MKNNEVYVIRYGFDYEHDHILGVYNSYYYAGKAKKEFIRSEANSQMQYHYIKIECYVLNESLNKDK
jgi:hypothetical protein